MLKFPIKPCSKYDWFPVVTRVTEKTDLAVFLTEICKDFQFDMKDNWENVTIITIDDKLEALK